MSPVSSRVAKRLPLQVYTPASGKVDVSRLPLNRQMKTDGPKFGPPHGPFYTSSLKRGGSDWLETAPRLGLGIGSEAAVFRISPSAKILSINPERNSEDIEPYLVIDSHGDQIVDWPHVAKDFDAVHVTHRPGSNSVLYGLDAESTAWFNTSMLELVDVYPVVSGKIKIASSISFKNRLRRALATEGLL